MHNLTPLIIYYAAGSALLCIYECSEYNLCKCDAFSNGPVASTAGAVCILTTIFARAMPRRDDL